MEAGMDSRKKSLLGRAVFLSWAYLYLLIDMWIPLIGDQGLIPRSVVQGGPDFLREKPYWITEMLIGNGYDNLFMELVFGPIYLLPIAFLYWLLIAFGPTGLCIWYTVKIWRQWKALSEPAEATTDLKGDKK